MKQALNALLLNKSLKELLSLSMQGLQLQSCILAHTPPLKLHAEGEIHFGENNAEFSGF